MLEKDMRGQSSVTFTENKSSIIQVKGEVDVASSHIGTTLETEEASKCISVIGQEDSFSVIQQKWQKYKKPPQPMSMSSWYCINSCNFLWVRDRPEKVPTTVRQNIVLLSQKLDENSTCFLDDSLRSAILDCRASGTSF